MLAPGRGLDQKHRVDGEEAAWILKTLLINSYAAYFKDDKKLGRDVLIDFKVARPCVTHLRISSVCV